MATKITKSGKAASVHDVREYLPQKLNAPGWTDLRVGFLVSVTKTSNTDDPAALTETIGTEPRPSLGSFDRYFIGVLGQLGHVFLGFTNRGQSTSGEFTQGSSKLIPSDGGIGVTNTNFWRPKNELSDTFSLQVIDTNITRAMGGDGSQIHLVQSAAGAGGYATLLMLRLQRDNAGSRAKTVSVSTKRDLVNHSGDVLFTNTPTKALLTANMQSFPTVVQQLGPIELTEEPTHIYIYWPFRNSRIRVHCHGVLKAG